MSSVKIDLKNKKTMSRDLKKLGNENSYTKDFFEELCKKIDLKDLSTKAVLKQTITLAAQAYLNFYNQYQSQLPPHEIKKELQKTVDHIDKAAESLIKVYASGNYGSDIINNLHDVIHEKYPSLHDTLEEIRRKNVWTTVTSPFKSIDFLASIGDAIERTIKNFPSRKVTPKSIALYHWIMILSARLEPIIGHKLEQSRYYKDEKGGSYISKKDISDSELLLFIIRPLDPNVTISQIETAIKESHEERHNTPWENYFPGG